MIALVSFVLFIILWILGVRFALIIAIFSGVAEVVPIIGPIVATVVAGGAAFLTGGSTTFALSPIQTASIVVAAYIIVRQLQDYFVVPYVMQRVTQLHPLIILFSALAGEHIAGMIGLILAIPVAAILKILLEYSLDKVNGSEK